MAKLDCLFSHVEYLRRTHHVSPNPWLRQHITRLQVPSAHVSTIIMTTIGWVSFPLSQIVNTDYFTPLLTVNQHASSKVLEEIPSVDTFASLSNWLLRPVPTVTAAVRRFKERYFEDNYVIGKKSVKLIHSTSIIQALLINVLVEYLRPGVLSSPQQLFRVLVGSGT